MIEKGKGRTKRVVPAPGIEGRDDGFHDGRMGGWANGRSRLSGDGAGENEDLFW